jgi:hypothetical protein
MQIGKLFQSTEYWFLYPSRETARCVSEGNAIAFFPTSTDIEYPKSRALTVAAYLSVRLDCAVSIVDPMSMFAILEKVGSYHMILTTQGNVGWIVCSDISEEAYVEQVYS